MTNHTTPVNRQAAIFLSKKKRVETVREALEKLSARILEPEVADNIIQMLANRSTDESPSLQMNIAIYRDPRTPDQFTVKMRTSIKTELGEELYNGLR